MKKPLYIILGCLLILFCLACYATKKAENEVKAAMQCYDSFILQVAADSIASLYTVDGEAFNNGELIAKGREAIRTFLHSFDGTVQVKANATTIDQVEVNGNTALLTGHYHQTALLLANQEEIKVQGIIETRWARQSNGKWLLTRMETKPQP